MPNLNRLNNDDFMAITRAMDSNRNNRIDKTEASISWRAQDNIGNSNGVAGTRETATALANGDVFVTGFQPAAADKIADYFSKRNENFNKPVAEWISDGFISKEDFELDADTRRALDSNFDNRISTREFSAALVSGTLTVGAARQVSQNPFAQPSQPSPSTNPFGGKPSEPSHSTNPFGNKPETRPTEYSQNPFGNNKPDTKPATGSYHEPEIRDSGAYLQIEMVRSLRSDFEKSQILGALAQKNDLSPREQVMLAEAATGLSSDFSRGQILQTMAGNRSLSDAGQVAVAKQARQLSSDFTRGQVVGALISNQKLGFQAQESVIVTIGTLSGDFSKTQQYISLNQNQKLHPENKAFLLRSAQEKVSSDFSKRQIMEALF